MLRKKKDEPLSDGAGASQDTYSIAIGVSKGNCNFETKWRVYIPHFFFCETAIACVEGISLRVDFYEVTKRGGIV